MIEVRSGDPCSDWRPLMDDERARVVIRGLRTGNPDAWRTLYDAFAERLWCCVARMIGPHPSDVADVVQEAMIAAAKSAKNYDETKGTLWQWLWGIARTQISLYYRKQQRHDRWKQIVRSEMAIEEHPLETAELAENVRYALNELPGDYDSLLTAKYLDGESVEQIAQRERSSETAVRSKLARARSAFRDVYLKLTGQREHETEATP